jgi:hypothetical protein
MQFQFELIIHSVAYCMTIFFPNGTTGNCFICEEITPLAVTGAGLVESEREAELQVLPSAGLASSSTFPVPASPAVGAGGGGGGGGTALGLAAIPLLPVPPGRLLLVTTSLSS